MYTALLRAVCNGGLCALILALTAPLLFLGWAVPVGCVGLVAFILGLWGEICVIQAVIPRQVYS